MGVPVTVAPPAPAAIVVPAEAYAAGRTVSLGLPVGRDRLDGNRLGIRVGEAQGDVQTRVLATWPDGDPKWILASFPAPADGAAPSRLELVIVPGPPEAAPPVASKIAGEIVAAAAGGTRFFVDASPGYGLVARLVGPDGRDFGRASGPLLDLVAVDDEGRTFRAFRDSVWIADNGPHRAVVAIAGRLAAGSTGGEPFLRFVVELEFEPNRAGPIVRTTLRNDDPSRRRNARFRSLSLVGRFEFDEAGFSVRCPLPKPGESWTASSDTVVVQGRTGADVRGAESSHFRGPEALGDGYSIRSSGSGERSFPPDSPPQSHWLIAGDSRREAFASTRHLGAFWGGFAARENGDLAIDLFAAEQGPHTLRYGSWETRESLVLAGPAGSIRGEAEAIAFQYPRLARLDDPAAWNRSGAYPVPLAPLSAREKTLESFEGAARRDLRTCPEAPYRVRYWSAGTAGGANQWDAAHDYWFAWASTGDPRAYLIAEAWADYRTDRAVPHAGVSDPLNGGEFPVTDDDEVFDNGHRHSRFLPLFFLQTGQLRFDIAAHDEFASLYGSDRISARYMESRITSRLIELGALYSGFASERALPDAPLLYPRVRDYLGHMLSLRWDFDDATGSEGWANDPNRRDRDPRTFWAASPGKGDPLLDVTFMVASLLPQALESWLAWAPPDDPHRTEVERRLVDLADFTWEHLIAKSEAPTHRGTYFYFDTRRGAPPAPGYGEPGFDPDDPPDLYHPLYAAFTAAHRVTGDPKYLSHGAYWAAAQSVRGAPWVTFHRPDFQSFAAAVIRARR